MQQAPAARRASLARLSVASTTIAAIVFTSLAGPGGAEAQQPKGPPAASASGSAAAPSADARKEAGERFKRGVKLQEEGSLDAAVIEFERAYELAPAFQVLYNIAVVYRDKNDRANALRTFERYLTEGGAKVDAKKKKIVEEEIAKLRELVATLIIKSNVADAEIALDDVPLGKASALQPMTINVGRHKLEATKDGFKGDTQLFTLAGKDNRTIELNLKEIKKVETPPPATTAPPPATTPPPPTTTAPPPPPPPESGTKTLGYALTIGGVLSLGVGGFFGLQASSAWDQAKEKCPNRICTSPTEQNNAERAGTYATVSTVGFALGGAALAGGLFFLLTSPSNKTAQHQLRLAPSVGQNQGGLVLGGGF